MANSLITILMATYNGEAYLGRQLDSIIFQTYSNWQLIIRDDLSTDGTPSVLKEYQKKDSRIKLIDSAGAHGSANINFSVLFDYAYKIDSKYIMLADQDDIWMPHKVQDSYDFIKKEEECSAPKTPILIYSSFQYVGADGSIINQNLKMPDMLKLPVLLNENHAYGCTMIFNNSLLKKIKHIPLEAEYHDYWISLVACTMGIAKFNPSKLLYYRQHDKNVSGSVANRKFINRWKRYFKNTSLMLPILKRNLKMIKLFFNNYESEFNDQQVNLISGYLENMQRDIVSLMFFMIRNRFRKVGLKQTIASYYLLLLLRRKLSKCHN